MRKLRTKCGYVAYEATAREMVSIGGLGICDHCNVPSLSGYLVPVLDHWICPKCFSEWNERSQFFEEDLWFEEQISARYERILPVERAST